MDKELLILFLKSSKESHLIDINEIQENVSKSKINNFLNELQNNGIFLQPTIDGGFQITPEQRAQLVILGAINGLDLVRIIKELTWQEFEILTTMVGDEFGYLATTGLNFSTQDRKYQIDVVLRNKPYVLLVDCKHFGGTGKQSILRKATEEQIARAEAVSKNLEKLKTKLQIRKWNKIILIPMIITWLDDEVFFYEKVPVVPFSKLRSFFRNFYVFIEDIYQIPLEI